MLYQKEELSSWQLINVTERYEEVGHTPPLTGDTDSDRSQRWPCKTLMVSFTFLNTHLELWKLCNRVFKLCTFEAKNEKWQTMNEGLFLFCILLKKIPWQNLWRIIQWKKVLVSVGEALLERHVLILFIYIRNLSHTRKMDQN